MVTDFATTILSYVGLAFDEKDNVAGRDFTSLLLSEDEAAELRAHGAEGGSSLRARPGAEADALILGDPALAGLTFHEYGEARIARGGGYKLIHRETGFDELFDLTNDPNETTNLLPTALTVLHGVGTPGYPGGGQAYPANLSVAGGRAGLEAAAHPTAGPDPLMLAAMLRQAMK